MNIKYNISKLKKESIESSLQCNSDSKLLYGKAIFMENIFYSVLIFSTFIICDTNIIKFLRPYYIVFFLPLIICCLLLWFRLKIYHLSNCNDKIDKYLNTNYYLLKDHNEDIVYVLKRTLFKYKLIGYCNNQKALQCSHIDPIEAPAVNTTQYYKTTLNNKRALQKQLKYKTSEISVIEFVLRYLLKIILIYFLFSCFSMIYMAPKIEYSSSKPHTFALTQFVSISSYIMLILPVAITYFVCFTILKHKTSYVANSQLQLPHNLDRVVYTGSHLFVLKETKPGKYKIIQALTLGEDFDINKFKQKHTIKDFQTMRIVIPESLNTRFEIV